MSFRNVYPLVAFAVAVLTATFSAAAQLSTLPVTIKNQKITVEVAVSEAERQHGLMNRFSLRKGQGRLFVFARPLPLVFWMRNTYIPLSVAFIDREGQILNVADMEPQTETKHPSAGTALYALEMRPGWFKDRGITPGAKVEGLEKAPKAID